MSRRKQARPKALKRLSQDMWEDGKTNAQICEETNSMFTTQDNDKSCEGILQLNMKQNVKQALSDDEMEVENVFLEEEDEQEMYNCGTCGSIFAGISRFMDHHNTICSASINAYQHVDSDDSPINTEGGAYQCQFCYKTFCRLSYLKRHEQIHSDKMPFRCEYCSRLFKHKRSRDRHTKLHTGDKRYQCSQCNTCFARSDHLKIHIRTHETTKNFQCTVCNYMFDTLALLTSHYQICHNLAPSVDDAKDTATESRQQNTCENDLSNQGYSLKDLKGKCINDEQRSASVPKDGISLEGRLEFKCPICPQMIFENEQALLKHQKSDHQSGYMHVYSCLHCGNEYHSLYNLREHLSSMHPDGSTTIATDVGNLSHNTCIFCRITFVSSDALQAHMSSNHPSQESVLQWNASGRFMCPHCRIEFSSDHALKEHSSITHGIDRSDISEQKTIVCPHCTKAYQNEEVLRTHINHTHRDHHLNIMRYPCPYCIKQNLFDSIEQLQLHIEVYHKSSRIPMHLCPEVDCKLYFNTQGDLTNHLKNDHKVMDTEAHTPDISPKPSPAIGTNNESYFSCPSCRNEFQSESQLMIHAVNHFKAVSSEYVCRDCGKSFKKPDELQKHLFEIHAHHLYKCALCKEVFDSKVSVQVHFAVKHSNECKLYSCTQCGVVYQREEDFIMHVRMQHVKVDQRCNICGLIFSSNVQLQTHLSSHTLVYRCSQCNTTYGDTRSYDAHMKSVHKIVPSPTVSLNGNSTKSPHEHTQPTINKPVISLTLDQTKIKNSPHSSEDGEEGCFICQICDVKFPLKSLLDRHHSKEHNIKSRRLTPDVYLPTVSSGVRCCENSQGMPVSNYNVKRFKASSENSDGLICMFCHNSILGENDLVFHSKKHKNRENESDTTFYCVVCMMQLTSIRNLRIHAHFHFQTSSSNDSRPQNCVMCGDNFRPANNDESPVCIRCISVDTRNQKQLFSKPAESVDILTKPGSYRCSHCTVKFESDVELAKHELLHNEVKKKTYQCIKCQKTFTSEDEIHAHVTSHMLAEGIYHECKLCKEVFDSPAKLQCHLIDHTFPDKNYECPKCDAKFIFAMDIQAHVIEHGIDAREHKCDLCNQTFFFSAELMNHVASYHHFENGRLREEYRCYECGRQFISRSNLYSHMKTHTAKERVCRCPLCPEVFRNTLAMQQHYFQSHTDVELVRNKKSLKCPKCDKTFICASALQTHVRQHNHLSPYSCNDCGKTFELVRNLTVHMAIHSNVNPFQCPLCDKRFSKNEQRKMHLKSHFNGMTEFSCPNCTQTFSKQTDIQNHMLNHVKKTNSQYKCYVCRAAFTDESTYRQHMQLMHGVQYDQVHEDLTVTSFELDSRKTETHRPTKKGSYTKIPENCCAMCNAMFPDDVALYGHLHTFHRIQFSSEEQMCYLSDATKPCSKTESEASQVHLNVHNPYNDSILTDKTTILKDSLDNRIYKEKLQKTADEKLSCPLCDDYFSTPESVRHHLTQIHCATTSKRKRTEESLGVNNKSKEILTKTSSRMDTGNLEFSSDGEPNVYNN